MLLPVGTYTVTVTAHGYATQTVSNVDVTQDATTTRDFNLTPVPGARAQRDDADGPERQRQGRAGRDVPARRAAREHRPRDRDRGERDAVDDHAGHRDHAGDLELSGHPRGRHWARTRRTSPGVATSDAALRDADPAPADRGDRPGPEHRRLHRPGRASVLRRSERQRHADHPGEHGRREPLRRLHDRRSRSPSRSRCTARATPTRTGELEREPPVRRHAEHGVHQQLPADDCAPGCRHRLLGRPAHDRPGRRHLHRGRRARAPNRQYIVEWRTGYANRSGNANFEAIFTEGSDVIRMRFGVDADHGLSETVGLQDSATRADQFLCNAGTSRTRARS